MGIGGLRAVANSSWRINCYERRRESEGGTQLPPDAGIILLSRVFTGGISGGGRGIAAHSDYAVPLARGGVLCAFFQALLRLALGQ